MTDQSGKTSDMPIVDAVIVWGFIAFAGMAVALVGVVFGWWQ